MSSTDDDDFPLAAALHELLAVDVEELIATGESPLLDHFTPVTSELLRHWFEADRCDIREANFHAGQRAALINIIYAHEVLHAPRLLDLYNALAPKALLRPGALGVVSNERNDHPKYAAKMATGTGKTWVLNALITWSYLNHVATPSDTRFTKNFLVIAPGLIVYERLLDSFMGKEHDGARDFETSDLYTFRQLFVPDTYRDQLFAFIQSSVTRKDEIGTKVTSGGMVAITNWHLLAGQEDDLFLPEEDDVTAPGADIDAAAAVRSFIPLTPGTAAGNALDGLDRKFLRGGALDSLVELDDLMVFNDEAHHVHSIKKGGEINEVEWQRSLNEIASTKAERFIQVDFSATPYNAIGTGAKTRKEWFPHIVVDFPLADAMKSGLVKAIALDRRKDLASLELDFSAERDDSGSVTGLSNGQRVMLRAGLTKLRILEQQFAGIDPSKHPKMLVMCEDTTVTPHVAQFFAGEGVDDDDVLTIDSKKKAELSPAAWGEVREQLFDIDARPEPSIIVSVLMLREGFDVNNICVVVPLRASAAPILLEQTIGRGLRLMWRGDDRVEEMKSETRDRIRQKLEPENYFDVLFIVEHPAFVQFYEELLAGGLAGEVEGDDSDVETRVTGDLETIGLRDGYEPFDFLIPVVIRDADEELVEPSVDPRSLSPGRHAGIEGGVIWLKDLLGKGDTFISHDAETGTQYGDYRVDGGVMTATGYGDYLSRLTNRIATALSGGVTSSAKKLNDIARFPLMLTYRPHLTGWIDIYIRERLFDTDFDPTVDENWRILLLPDVIDDISSKFATALVETIANADLGGADVLHRAVSDVSSITVRTSASVEVTRCIFQRLPYPVRAGGLEKRFLEWAESDTKIEAFLKVDERKHTMVHRPYLKADGMPAYYSPDFLVRTATDVFVVETKAQGALSDENVRRKKRAALSWVQQINRLHPEQRSDREWNYVLLGQDTVETWHQSGSRCSELLDYARLVPEGPAQPTMF